MAKKYFEFVCPVKILSGRKAISNLPYELSQLGAKRPMIITDKGVAGAGLIKPIKSAFADSDLEIGVVFEDTPVDSSNRVVNKVADIYRSNGCDSLVAVGGGSVLDTAKGANIVLSENSDDLLNFQGVDRLTAQMEPFIAVPTTAGTGSEVTAAAVIYNEEEGVKMAFMSNRLYPNAAIVDPVMMMTMPPKITAATGMDALTHAVEAYICIQKNPVSDAFAVAAVNLIRDNLAEAVEHGDNEKARINMADAALLAGIAFSNSMVGMVHALAHACGGAAHVPHGVANAILLPFGMEYNIDRAAEELAELGSILAKGEDIRDLDMKDKAMQAVRKVRDLNEELKRLCGLPLTLSDAGVKEEQLEEIAKLAVNDGSLTFNPEEVDYDDALRILKEAF